MIYRKSDGLILYGDNWFVSDGSVRSKDGKRVDSSTNTDDIVFESVDLPSYVWVGKHCYNPLTGTFNYNTSSREETLSFYRDEINKIREEKSVTVIPIEISNGTHLFLCTEENAAQIALRYLFSTNAIINTPSYWRDYDNNNVPIITDDLKTIAYEMDNYLMKLGAESHRVKDMSLPATVDLNELRRICQEFREYDPLSP